MKHLLLILTFVLGYSSQILAQITIFSHAGGGSEPSGWSFTNNVATNAVDRTSYWLVDAGSPSDIITTSSYDLSSYASASLAIRVATFGSNANNPAKIEISYDGGSTYTQTTTTATPTSSSYIDGGPISLNSISNQVVIRISNNGTAGKGVRLQNIILTAEGSATPTVSIANTGSPTAGDILQNTSDALLFGFSLTPSASVDFTAVEIATTGTAESTDVSNFRLILDANSNGIFDGGETVVKTVASLANPLTFNTFDNAQNGLEAETRYLVVADFSETAVVGRTLSLSIADATDVTTTGDESGTATGNTQTVISATAPVITVTGTLDSFGNTALGSSSSSQTYTVEGANLEADITITAPSGFQISEDAETFVSIIILEHAGGTVGETTIYARFTPVSASGAISNNILHESGDASDQNQAVSGFAYDSEPTSPSSSLTFDTVNETSLEFSWTRGNGDSVLVVMKSSSSVDFDPSDLNFYTANSSFGSGTQQGTGNYVVYSGTGTSVSVTNLTQSTPYHVEIFEFNASETNGTQNFNISSTLIGSQTTEGPDFTESIESGSKGSYSDGVVALSSGNWQLTDALIGTLANDRKNGTQSVRIQSSGILRMNFDVVSVGSISFLHGKYGTDGDATITTAYSIDGGTSWTNLGTANVTSTTLTEQQYSVNILGPIRFRFSKSGGTRINIDDIEINYTTTGSTYREITGTAGWRMLSSPKAGFTVADISDDTAIQGVADGTNPAAASNFYTYNSNGSFQTPTNVNTAIGNGSGFITYFFNNSLEGSSPLPITLDVTGSEVGSDVTVSLNKTTLSNSKYYTLVGNPFASNIELSALTSDGILPLDVQVWDNATSDYVDVLVASGILQPWQGFWVSVGSSDEGTQITIPTSAKTSTASTDAYFKTSQTAQFSLTHNGITTSPFQVRFNEEAQLGEDRFDAAKLTPLSSEFAVLGAVQVGNSILKSIESLPLELSETVEMFVQPSIQGKSGEFTLAWDGFSSIPSHLSAHLIDSETNSTYDLKSSGSVVFNFVSTQKAAKNLPIEQPMLLATENNRFKVVITPITTSVEASELLPTKLELGQNFPNPFNPSTHIKFAIPAQTQVRLTVFDMLGREVSVLVNRQYAAGNYEVNFDASTLSSGMYIYRLEANGSVMTKKMTLIK